MDLDDLLRITDEGKAGYVTTWVNLTAGLGGISTPSSFPGGIYFFKHDMRGDADEDPRFKATFQALSGTLGVGHFVVGVDLFKADKGKIHPLSGDYEIYLTCTQGTFGGDLEER